MIAPLLAAALIATPIQTPDHFDLVERSVNIAKPTAGAWDDQIVSASTVPKKWRAFATCVLDRESGATLREIQSGAGAKNPRSSASGRFQFLDSSWRVGGSLMVKDRHVRVGVPKSHARDVREHLGRTPIHKWHGHWQQTLFNEAVVRGGWFHWRNGDHCDGKRP